MILTSSLPLSTKMLVDYCCHMPAGSPTKPTFALLSAIRSHFFPSVKLSRGPYGGSFSRIFRAPLTSIIEAVSPRYRYGELRLDRLNQIYRFSPAILYSQEHALIGNFFHPYHKCSSFFKESFSWLIVLFAYFTTYSLPCELAWHQRGSAPARPSNTPLADSRSSLSLSLLIWWELSSLSPCSWLPRMFWLP